MLLSIFTFDRPDYLAACLNSFEKYNSYITEVIIYNDSIVNVPQSKYKVINSNRKGIHHAKNLALKYFEDSRHDVMFMCEDDVLFKMKGWENAYTREPEQYICHFDTIWAGKSQSGHPFRSHGAFCKITKEVVKRIGFYDVKNMGFRGIGHLDYALRYCREFNQESFFDIKAGMEYIELIKDNYRHSLPKETILKFRQTQSRKIQIANNRTSNYVPFIS